MKTLIVYASKYGCTEKCANILAKKLTGEVEIINLKINENVDLSQYDKVIIGSSIYVGKIQKKVNEFCQSNLVSLKEKTLGFFICCMHEDEKAENQLNNAFPLELLSSAVAKEYFGGEFRFKKMNFLEKFIVKKVNRAESNKPELDTSKDLSTISEEKIENFVQLINKA